MRNVILAAVTTLLFSATALFGDSRQTSSLVRIDFAAERLRLIEQLQQMGVDIAYFNGKERFLEAIIRSDQRQAIAKMGLKTTPIIDDLAAYTEQLRNENYFKPFHSYAEMLQEMQQIVADHPDLASLHDIGDSYNKVHDLGGYDIWALKISDQVAIEDSTEADALFMANIHAREVITPEIIMYFMHYLVDHYGSDSYVTHLLNNREIWLIPTANPDGHEYVFSGNIAAANSGPYNDPVWWRKNMRDNNNNGGFDDWYDGVDLNRNFSYMWGYNNSGSSGYPSSETYRGPDLFSEPEIQALRDFVIAHDFIVSLSYHSYGRFWLYPWGYVADNPPEPDGSAFRALGDSCVAYNGYEAGNYYTGTIYQTNGDSDDWLYGERKIFAFTPEVGSIEQGRFWPDTTLILPLILENLGPNLYLTYAAGEEPIVSHQQLADVQDPIDSLVLRATITPPIQLTTLRLIDPSSFKVYFKNSGAAAFDSSQLVSTGIGDQYIAEIPSAGLDSTVLYFVQAKDEIGRTGTSPRGAPTALDSFQVTRTNTGFRPPVAQLPERFELEQNFPNPFNARTRFRITLPKASTITVTIYNQAGQRIKSLLGGEMPAGHHFVDWDGTNEAGISCGSGVFVCRFETQGAQITRKVLLLK